MSFLFLRAISVLLSFSPFIISLALKVKSFDVKKMKINAILFRLSIHFTNFYIYVFTLWCFCRKPFENVKTNLDSTV